MRYNNICIYMYIYIHTVYIVGYDTYGKTKSLRLGKRQIFLVGFSDKSMAAQVCTLRFLCSNVTVRWFP